MNETNILLVDDDYIMNFISEKILRDGLQQYYSGHRWQTRILPLEWRIIERRLTKRMRNV